MSETILALGGQLSLAGRAAAGAALSVVIAGIAWRAGSLNRSGLAAAVVCGTLSLTGGWGWGALLLLYFVAASVLSQAGRREKELRIGGIVSKGGGRDAVQVFANGGVYSLAAALTATVTAPWLAAGALGALAAASADTWGTEIGTWRGGSPRSIVSRTTVRTGESGGITTIGTVGSFAGAAWVGLAAIALGFSSGLGIASVIAGAGGALVDSVAGATIQERRWCARCAEPTERTVHLCGCATDRVGGIRGLDNDLINLLSTVTGFLLGVVVYWIANGPRSWSAIG
jgi:uncharacterized protein (TIGR00297 family)